MIKSFGVNVLLSEDASVAEVTGAVAYNGVGELRGKGAAKRHPKDNPDEQVGYSLAVARALRDLADKYEQRAEEAMERPKLQAFFNGATLLTYSPGDPNQFTTLNTAH